MELRGSVLSSIATVCRDEREGRDYARGVRNEGRGRRMVLVPVAGTSCAGACAPLRLFKCEGVRCAV